MNALITSLIFLGLVRHSHQIENDTNYFVSPPPSGTSTLVVDDSVLLLDSSFMVQWVTTLPSYEVNVWQQDLTKAAATNGSVLYSKVPDQSEQGGFSWTVNTGVLDLSISNVYFLLLSPDGSIGSGITSHYFNITANAADVSSSTLPSSSTTPASPTSLSTSNAGATTTTGSSTSTSSLLSSTTPVPSAASSSTKIGLGVGLGVGIPIVIILAAILILKVRQHKKDSNTRADHNAQYNPVEGQPTGIEKPPPSYGQGGRFEMPGTTVSNVPYERQRTAAELPSSGR